MYNISNLSKKEITNIWHNYVKSGDSKHLGEIYKKFNQIIYFVAYKILRDRNKASDVTHDVFEQLILNRERYTNVSNFSAWIYSITRNLALKRRKKDLTFEIFEEVHAHLGGSYEFEIGESLTAERLRLLETCISQFEGKNFAMIINLELDGMNNKEIADAIGRTEKYVRDRKHLAKKELNTKMRAAFESQMST